VLHSHHQSPELQIKRIHHTGLLPSPQPHPRLERQDRSACHRALPHHLLGDGPKSSTLFPKLRPQAQHEASRACQQPGTCFGLSGGQESLNNRWPFLDLCLRVYGEWIWEQPYFTKGANWEEKATVKCHCILFSLQDGPKQNVFCILTGTWLTKNKDLQPVCHWNK